MNSQYQSQNVLVGDVGGTKTLIALVSVPKSATQTLEILKLHRYKSDDFKSLSDVVQCFTNDYHDEFPILDNRAALRGCFGVPGPVILQPDSAGKLYGTVKLTNLPWSFTELELSADLKMPVRLVNDLVAMGHAVPFLSPDQYTTLYCGDEPQNKFLNQRETRLIVAPGTGLGHALIQPIGDNQDVTTNNFAVFGSEAGHMDYAPVTDLEIELLQYLRHKFARRISVERVVSGIGIENIYQFLHSRSTTLPKADAASILINPDDPGAAAGEIGRLGLAYQPSSSNSSTQTIEELCSQTLDLFVGNLGSHAGSMVLGFMATGGVFLGGGVSTKLLSKLKQECLKTRYLNKGRLSHIVAKTPLHVITDDHIGIRGSARIAAQLGLLT